MGETAMTLPRIAVSIIVFLTIIGIVFGLLSMLLNQSNTTIDEMAHAELTYDVASLDDKKVSGSALQSLIIRGVPVMNTATGTTSLTVQQIRSKYYSDGWYYVMVVDVGNYDVVVVEAGDK